MLDGACLSDASENAGDTEKPPRRVRAKEEGDKGAASPPQRKKQKSENKERREEACYRKGVGKVLPISDPGWLFFP